MKLSIAERLQFGAILPKEGNSVTMSVKRDISDRVALTQDEIEKWGVGTEKVGDVSRFTWNSEAQDADIDFTETELSLIRKSLEELDRSQKLDDFSFAVYDKFINKRQI